MTVVQRKVRNYIAMQSWSWFNLWQKVRPLINQPRVEDEIRKLEERANAACSELEKETNLIETLTASNASLLAEKEALAKTIEETKGNMSEFMDSLARIAAEKAELEILLTDTSAKLIAEEEAR
ncbi:hypothetical protein GPU83_09460, partial [Streptococcus thermophilus]|nr:hypothetical protein [Streptococcus thermophilus]